MPSHCPEPHRVSRPGRIQNLWSVKDIVALTENPKYIRRDEDYGLLAVEPEPKGETKKRASKKAARR